MELVIVGETYSPPSSYSVYLPYLYTGYGLHTLGMHYRILGRLVRRYGNTVQYVSMVRILQMADTGIIITILFTIIIIPVILLYRVLGIHAEEQQQKTNV